MLFSFDPGTRELDRIDWVSAADAGVTEAQIEKALASCPASLFAARKDGEPILVVKTSKQGARMPDVIALDSQGRLVLVECKRASADRDTLAQLLDYASDYDQEAFKHLLRDWETGEGEGKPVGLLERFQEFADDPTVAEERLGKEQVLVVVAAGEGSDFTRIAAYLKKRGVPVYFVPARIFRRKNGELLMNVEPVRLDPEAIAGNEDGLGAEQVWMINTDETHCPGAYQRFLDVGVAAIWGFPDHETTLDQGARPGDTIYAYRNGMGIIARGLVDDGRPRPADKSTTVFNEYESGNEWYIRVKWTPLSAPITNATVREGTGTSLPVRNTFCRLWNPGVRRFLQRHSA